MSESQKSFILVVDDNPKNLQVLGNILREHHYKTAVARDGQKALQFVQKKLPDLILLDVMMPEIDGFEACRRLKADEKTRDIPVIFITALTSPENRLEGFKVGGVDYITKPFQKEEVLARVQAHVALRRAYTEVRSLNRQLQEANASKDTFFSIIAHDLRSPFTGLLGITHMILTHLDEFDLADIKKNVGTLESAAKTIYALLENLLTWSRIQRGAMKNFPETIALDEIADHTISLFRSNAEQKQISLTSRIPQDAIAYADSNMVNTIMRNLISNALKFTPPGGAITVSANRTDAGIEVAISDTGVGMTQKEVARLFRIDVKFTSPGTNGEKGTGLGLILCKELVEENRGRMWVESERGTGTTFTFFLPVHGEESHATTAHSQNDQGAAEHPSSEAWLTQPSTPPTAAEAITPAMLTVLPAELRAVLQQAVEAIDIDLFPKLTDRIRQHDAALADAISELAANYRFDILQALFEEKSRDA